jgi:hypothetical protein
MIRKVVQTFIQIRVHNRDAFGNALEHKIVNDFDAMALDIFAVHQFLQQLAATASKVENAAAGLHEFVDDL